VAELFIAKLLKPEQVLLKFISSERDGAIRELVGLVAEFKNRPVERDAFAAAVLERERMHSTGIGEGVALPHARNQQSTLLPNPVVVFGRHSSGLPFGAVDQKPVNLLFLLSAPDLTQHLRMLAVLSRLMRNDSLRQELLRVPTPAKVIELLIEGERNLGR
jgi:mannitol/fructose-specific phosphotransferase system IIA component (Ntr-type)